MKIFKPPPSLHSHPISNLHVPALLVWTSLNSEPREGEEPRGWGGPGYLLQVRTSSPSAGQGGMNSLFMYLVHIHHPMQVSHPGFCQFLCLIPSSSQGLSNPPSN